LSFLFIELTPALEKVRQSMLEGFISVFWRILQHLKATTVDLPDPALARTHKGPLMASTAFFWLGFKVSYPSWKLLLLFIIYILLDLDHIFAILFIVTK
jgi:hypothetical protein